ncbi:acetaldehyde dehydrogenase [Geomicrobium sp. JCM 19039]|nr:acetaldehyde dehydrogenase [Geomicrobium sp. JCM 19039]
MALAKEHGLKPIYTSIEGFQEEPELADIVFEATSAKAHQSNAPILKEMGKRAIDLTPAAIGPFFVPAVQEDANSVVELDNVNMVTCGGQATIPMIKAVSDVVGVDYAEIVASISSKSAGIGTRQNIDEFTVTTARAIEQVANVKEGKAIIILNPADPPVLMRNTIHMQLSEDADTHTENILASLEETLKKVQAYVPGYRFKADPVIQGKIVTVSVEVEGNGDFLPTYSGNLDIITSAAVKTGELMADHMMVKEY